MQGRTRHSPAPDWINISGGWFDMGGGPRSNENPRHRVWVDAFRLARFQVTRQEYQVFLDATKRQPPSCWHDEALAHPRMPAAGPSWDDAVAFCDWVAETCQQSVRLPSEAEWEFAALGGRQVTYPWGDDLQAVPDLKQRWQDGPEPVDLYPSLHPWGFVGLGENVHEWCSDWYDADYYADSPQRNPRGPDGGKRRSSRGGAWRHRVKVSRCAARSSIPPHAQYNDYGFRLASGS